MLFDRKRIMIVGSSGAGKSTFARELGRITGLPVVHLDRHYWTPGWVPTPREEWREKVEVFASNDRWIIDGNYGSTLDIRVKRCDAIVFFDFSRLICIWGASKRMLLYHGKSRPDMGEGCPERLDWSFLRWIWRFSETSRPKVVRAISQAGSDVEVVTLRTRLDVRNLLDGGGVKSGITKADSTSLDLR